MTRTQRTAADQLAARDLADRQRDHAVVLVGCLGGRDVARVLFACLRQLTRLYVAGCRSLGARLGARIRGRR